MANIFSLFGRIFVDNEKANKSIDDTKNKAKDSSKSFAESFSNVAKKTMQIGTAVVGAATTVVGGITAMATNVADEAGAIDDAAKKVGTSAEEYQKWAYAAKLGGMETSKLEALMIKQQKAFSDAKEGSKSMSEAYQRLGIDINNIGSSGDAFNLVIAKLADMEDATTRNALANDIFGKSYADLAPMLAEGSAGIEAWKQECDDLGGVLSNDAVTAGADFGDMIDRVKTSFSGMYKQLISKALPIISQLLQIILDNLPAIQSMFDALAPVLVDTLNAILPVFVQFVSDLLPIIVDLITQLMPTITTIIQELLPIFSQILSIILPPIIQIVQQLLPVLLPIIEALLPLLTPLLELLSFLIDMTLKPIINVISSIANVISNVLVKALKFLTPVVEGVKTVFSNVFGTLINIVKAPINFIISGINLFIKALNKIKVPDWVPGIGGKGINIPLIQKLRVGIDSVPYDEMPAILHKGEAVLDKEDAEEYRNNRGKKIENKIVNNYYNTINIDELNCKEEKDIKRIAEELYYLQKRSEV